MKKGISMIALVVTISVMLILTGVIFMSTEELSDEAKALILLDEMKLLQAKVLEYQLKYEDNSIEYPYVGELVTQGEYLNYYEVSKEELEQMEIFNIDNTYLINYASQDIVYKDGISIGGVICYTIDEIDEKVNVLKK